MLDGNLFSEPPLFLLLLVELDNLNCANSLPAPAATAVVDVGCCSRCCCCWPLLSPNCVLHWVGYRHRRSPLAGPIHFYSPSLGHERVNECEFVCLPPPLSSSPSVRRCNFVIAIQHISDTWCGIMPPAAAAAALAARQQPVCLAECICPDAYTGCSIFLQTVLFFPSHNVTEHTTHCILLWLTSAQCPPLNCCLSCSKWVH